MLLLRIDCCCEPRLNNLAPSDYPVSLKLKEPDELSSLGQNTK